jgi:Ubiquitin-protein ligase
MGLPREILMKRIANELQTCSDYLNAEIPFDPKEAKAFPLSVRIDMVNVPGYVKKGPDVFLENNHSFMLILSEEYGFERPGVEWLTPIFHPNIMMPDDGGLVCLRTASTWEFGSTLLSFIKSIEQLVMAPNPKNPLFTDSCTEASKFFMDNESKFEVSISYGGR